MLLHLGSNDVPAHLGPSDVINLVALLVALAALAVSLYSWRTSSRGARNDVLAQVRDWGGEVVHMLSDASAICHPEQITLASADFALKRVDLRSRSSALLDRGRFFFPNLQPGNDGGAKTPAFQGVRPAILDLVLLGYELVGSLGDKEIDQERLRLAFVCLKRAFVSTIQDATRFAAPPTLKQYEEYLAGIRPKPLPTEVAQLGHQGHYFELRFDSDLRLEDC